MAYKQRWQDFFEVLDSNHNGFVEPTDGPIVGKKIAAALGKEEGGEEYKEIVESFDEFLKEVIHGFDLDKDGKVSKEEFFVSVDNIFIGKKLEEIPDWWKTRIAESFYVLGADHLGTVTKEGVVDNIHRFSPGVPVAAIEKAYDWAAGLSGSGKYDVNGFYKVVYEWATNPNPTPEADILTPFFRKF